MDRGFARAEDRADSVGGMAPEAAPHHRRGCGRRERTPRRCRLQIFAYKTQQILMTNMARQAPGARTRLLGGRILELLRIRSAQLGECQPCMQSRKHDSITDEDVACLIAPGHGGDLTEQERLAISVPRPALGRSSRHRRRDLPQARRGLHGGADRRARLRLCQLHGPAPLHPHARRLRHQRTGHPFSPDQVDAAQAGRRVGRRHGVSQTVLVTGATGLAGANICKLLIERGDHVRALARETRGHRAAGGARGSRWSPAT